VITEIIQKLVDRQNLTPAEARAAMDEILAGNATEAQIASFLTALRMKGETPEELIGFARVMRERAEPFWDGDVLPVLDTCGTGGDRSGTFNISSAAAFVVAGAGIPVAKHGNRSATSQCGSADVMEALGIDIQLPVPRLRAAVSEIGIGFLFAQRFHRSMKHVAPVRSQLKVRTVFNILGPLANPAAARFQVVGVFSPAIQRLMADALAGLGLERAFVVHGSDGVDEISISAKTSVVEVHGGQSRTLTISPEDFGIAPAPAETLKGGNASQNAAIIESILKGESGPRRDVVLMNAAPAVVAAGGAKDLQEGLRLAANSIDTGEALRRLNALREWR
jgi:anthranilate phosphoribosyltransferase